MKNLIARIKLPAFLEDLRLRYISIVMVLLTLAGITVGFFIRPWLALVLLLLLVGIMVTSFYELETITKNTNQYISDLSYRIKRGEQEALIKMPVGILIYDKSLNIEWMNPYLQQYFDNTELLGKPLDVIDAELADLIKSNQDTGETKIVHWGEHQFEIIVQKSIGVVYLMDVTRYAAIEEKAEEERLAIGQIFLDNYDEITQSLDDQVVSNLNNYVTNQLTDWANQFGMFLKRVDDDHFIVIAYVRALTALQNDKFKILDVIRQDTSKQNYPLTLSVGIAYGDEDLAQLALTSQSNLDLALGRGGDQVVVKSKDGQARFYGGKTNPMEKRTRVRARMISQALQELFKQTDTVFVVGHSRPDMDAIGASMGIRRIAQMNGIDCRIVVDPENLHSDVERLMEATANDPELANAIITPEAAVAAATDQSMIVMVDHSKPSITAAPDLYEKLSSRAVIIDHHRRGEEFPDNPMLVYIEPYASSTCELITEMFEYQPTGVPAINKLEATAMLAGITVDTKSFSLRTGTRTFDAASYLRSMGANALMIQNLLKENVDSYIQKNHLIDTIEMVATGMALCTGEDDRIYDPVIAAQAADSLLSLSGIEAGYVITRRSEDQIGISARSLGDINVQVVMERLGGGGHLSNAATQIKDHSVAEAKQMLIDAIQAVAEED
ncbi:DHH family phosphoesterase [Lacticaseibacillus saniviri]|uniref:Cyclic-di-AMP phosphodiesterase n=1 Tax=Lacticaseibacillus saniviri JCM 17471 = DSM 24301 TaxID=1293598 RepID=A0A0R2MW44_9LACO|nr:DHH family phosphoesterase [Lacticaseibacillus saniviri]KRO16464.1 Signaling protein (Consists of PAS, a modified GGDEF and a DHH family phosphatase domains) [Lacticaseibacillus saniviri JCM 17471 = DSM 24301]MCG4282000.1 DHH family phosphoesterase [Lacticaseibacillus saniviri]